MRAKGTGRFKWPNTMIDMTGKVIGHLTVLRPGKSDGQHRRWICRCDCGTEKEFCGQRLRRGDVLHCGCRGRRAPVTAPTHDAYNAAQQAAAFADLDAAWGRMWTVLRNEAPRPDHS